MGSRCAFSALKRREARRPACVLPRAKPQVKALKPARSMRLSKLMPRRSGEVRWRVGLGAGRMDSEGGVVAEESEGGGVGSGVVVIVKVV